MEGDLSALVALSGSLADSKSSAFGLSDIEHVRQVDTGWREIGRQGVNDETVPFGTNGVQTVVEHAAYPAPLAEVSWTL